MREVFSEFYRLDQSSLDDVWASATIVLDTNVLLSLYRFPEESRNNLFRVLRAFQDRLWIPHHVALEYQRRRTKVASDQDRIATQTVQACDAMLRKLRQSFVHLAQRHPTLDIETISDAIRAFEKKLLATLESTAEAHPDVLSQDLIRDELDSLFADRVGPSPNRDWLTGVTKEGDVRFASKIPPGFEDAGKKGEKFMHGGLIYSNKFGDLIIWKQILEKFSDSSEPAKLIFVTDDQKSDWWQFNPSNSSLRIGPRIELVSELSKGNPDCKFLMLTTREFLKAGAQRASVSISSTLPGIVNESFLDDEEAIGRVRFTKDRDFEPPMSRLHRTDAYPPLMGINKYIKIEQGVDVVNITTETERQIKTKLATAISRAEEHNKMMEIRHGRVAIIVIILPCLKYADSIYKYMCNLNEINPAYLKREISIRPTLRPTLNLFVQAQFNGNIIPTLSLIGHAG